MACIDVALKPPESTSSDGRNNGAVWEDHSVVPALWIDSHLLELIFRDDEVVACQELVLARTQEIEVLVPSDHEGNITSCDRIS